MIAYLALGLIGAAGLLMVLDWWAKAETRSAKKILMVVASLLTLLSVVFLATRGQWILALVPALFTLNRFLGIGRRLFGFRHYFFGKSFEKNTSETKTGHSKKYTHYGRDQKSSETLSSSEALDILGLTKGATRQEIQSAYKKMMARCHPDKGGNSWLAERINTARDTLLNNSGNQ